MNRLKELRKEKGLTLEEIAGKLNTTSMSLSRYERGEREPKGSVLLDLASLLNVSPDYLLGRTNNREQSERLIYLSEAQFLLFEEIKHFDDESLQDLINMAKIIKKREL